MYKSLSHQDQLRFLSPFILFKTPVKKPQESLPSRYNFSKAYELSLPGPEGKDRFIVCRLYFKWFFGFGKDRFHSIMRTTYQSRVWNEIWITHKQNYKGYRNKDVEPEWRLEWAQWAVVTKDLIKSHYTRDKDTVYFESENGIKHTWTSLYMEWIRDTQPESYRNWLVKNPPEDPSIPKPRISLSQFLKVIPHIFKCKPKRIAQDVCNGCEQLSVLLRDATTEHEKDEVRALIQFHMDRARMMYQLNTHFKKLSTKSFEDQNILIRRGTPPMEHKGTFVHIEFDYDLDHPEIFDVLNMVYFKRKITMKSLNVVQHPADSMGSRKVFAWSGMVGGKAAEETIQCLDHTFGARSIGAERCFLNCDGALLTYNLLRFAVFCCLPQNPNRYFKSVCCLSPETGHSRLEADGINQQTSAQYRKKQKWSKCSERVDYINERTEIEMKEWTYFGTLPSLFDKIFLGSDKWLDQFEKGMLIKNDKGMMYECCESLEWNAEEEGFVWVAHPQEIWIRCHHDLKAGFRKIRIMKDGWDKLGAEEWTRLRRDRKAPPVIKRDTLNDTLEIVNFFENAQELRQYYVPTEIDESGEIKQVKSTQNYSKIVTKLRRRSTYEKMIETKQSLELEPYERKKAEDKTVCDSAVGIALGDIDSKTVKDLKAEIKNHDLSCGSKKKTELQKLLREHLQSCHGQERSGETVCEQTVEIGLEQISGSLVKELREEVKAHGVKAKSGRKADLQSALREHLDLFHAEDQQEETVSDQGMDLDGESESEQVVVNDSTRELEIESDSDDDSGVID